MKRTGVEERRRELEWRMIDRSAWLNVDRRCNESVIWRKSPFLLHRNVFIRGALGMTAPATWNYQ